MLVDAVDAYQPMNRKNNLNTAEPLATLFARPRANASGYQVALLASEIKGKYSQYKRKYNVNETEAMAELDRSNGTMRTTFLHPGL